MKTSWFKWTSSILAGLILILALPGFIDWGIAKPWLNKELSLMLQRHTRVNGAIHFQLLPYPGIRASDVEIHRNTNPDSPSFMTLKTLDLHAAWLPLLGAQIQIDSLSLDTPVIELDMVRLPALNAPLPETKDPDAATEETAWFNTIIVPQWLAAFHNTVELKEIIVKNGTVRVFSRNRNEGFELQQLSLHATAHSLVGPVSLSANFNIDTRNYTMNALLGVPTDSGVVPFEVTSDETNSGRRYYAKGALEGLFAENPDRKRRFAIHGDVTLHVSGQPATLAAFVIDRNKIQWPEFGE